MTMKFGLLGAKLGHSLSPQIHTELYKILQLDAAYGLIEVRQSSWQPRLRHCGRTIRG